MLMDGWKGACITVVITCKLYTQCTNKNYIPLENRSIGRLSLVLAAIYRESRENLSAFRFQAGYFAEITCLSWVKKKCEYANLKCPRTGFYGQYSGSFASQAAGYLGQSPTKQCVSVMSSVTWHLQYLIRVRVNWVRHMATSLRLITPPNSILGVLYKGAVAYGVVTPSRSDTNIYYTCRRLPYYICTQLHFDPPPIFKPPLYPNIAEL